MDPGVEPSAGVMEIARPIFLRWERLRIPYNLVLLAATLIFHGGMFCFPGAWLIVAIFAIGAALANVCFLAGPLVESYLAWLGIRSRWIPVVLFTGGLLVSIPLVLIFPFGFPHG
jgi:hypothetical protein